MMTITTNNSNNVNPCLLYFMAFDFEFNEK